MEAMTIADKGARVSVALPARLPTALDARRGLSGTVECGYNRSMAGSTSPPPASVGIRELKNRLSAHLDRVKAGEEITVTEHGRPIARLTPVGPDVDRMTALVNSGIVRAPANTTRRLPARRVRLTGAGSVDDEVADQRR
jgi:prevent-host-death family protein